VDIIITNILAPIGMVTGAITGTISVGNLVVSQIRKWAQSRKKKEILEFIKQLGLKSEADVRAAVDAWDMPKAFTEDHRNDLVKLLVNLTRGARFHSTQGTALSSYLKCQHLLDQLLENVQPKHRAGEKVSDWELQRFLGMGSFGEVWMAANPHHPQRRAYKFFTQPDALEWLKLEGDALAAVLNRLADCPNVIEYIDFVGSAKPDPYLVVEFVAGGSLEDWILAGPEERAKLDVAETMHGLARGVAEAHKHTIFHRDLKPANVLLTDDAEPIAKIADFGLSRVEARTETQSSVASQSVLVGTRMYHPPEASDPLEHREPAQDDVFALGVIWYQTLMGKIERPPYDFAERLANADVDSRTVRMISRCLAHPTRRYKTACELFEDLDVETPSPVWKVPDGCFDVGPIACEYVERSMR
jgi:serine/threonine protein kinase